ncbi:aldo/keto reductase [Oscillibacter sp.]|uniref:aldo/keto reductase n=1 Tax=Oscillibacter sp. TaxID=1945593 RepID=UPI002635A78E|nr:aldo/keto reductase [Oscillibacter sp.]MDD3347848.1 aldo/keto reductase [Oscillibacter sp.]
MVKLDEIFPVGIGTYRLEQSDKATALSGLHYSIERGQNFLSTGFSYADGAVVELLSAFFPTIDREKLFLCTYVEPNVHTAGAVEGQLNAYLKQLHTDYVDCYQVHNPFETDLPLETMYEEIFRLKREGKVRYVGASNVSPKDWKRLTEQGTLDFFEGIYNFECRNYETNGVMADCRERNIRFVCYQPLRRNRTAQKQYPLLLELAKKYGCTQNQVILNWLAHQKRLQTIVKSLTPANIDANLAALDFKMEAADDCRMDAFCCPECEQIPVDWDHSGVGVPIHLLANQF